MRRNREAITTVEINAMDKSKSWWGGFVCGFSGVLILGIFLHFMAGFVRGEGISDTALANLSEGLWNASSMAKVFTSCNGLVFLLPFLVWGLYRKWYAAWFLFLRKLPTMIGMLGTLWSLVESDMTDPGSLAKKFSVAIASTFLGLVVQIVMELVGRFPCFKAELDKNSDASEEE